MSDLPKEILSSKTYTILSTQVTLPKYMKKTHAYLDLIKRCIIRILMKDLPVDE